MTEAEYLYGCDEALRTTLATASRIGETPGWAYARALPRIMILGREYSGAAYLAHIEKLLRA